MTIEQAMELIHGVEWRGSRPGLSRVRELLHRRTTETTVSSRISSLAERYSTASPTFRRF